MMVGGEEAVLIVWHEAGTATHMYDLIVIATKVGYRQAEVAGLKKEEQIDCSRLNAKISWTLRQGCLVSGEFS